LGDDDLGAAVEVGEWMKLGTLLVHYCELQLWQRLAQMVRRWAREFVELMEVAWLMADWGMALVLVVHCCCCTHAVCGLGRFPSLVLEVAVEAVATVRQPTLASFRQMTRAQDGLVIV
jgi:hypothetical protein